MKKILAIAIALVMLCACTFSVSAAETTLDDIDTGNWWTNLGNVFPVTEDGVTITFTSTSYETAVNNWECPAVITFTSDNAVIGGDNYVEYWIHRADNWGWSAAIGNSPFGDMNSDDTNADNIAALAAKGITIDRSFGEGDIWTDVPGYFKAGVEMTVTAKLVDGNAVVSISHERITNTITMPVDISRTTYICLTGEHCNLTNVKVSTPDAPDAPPVTGDMAGVVIAMMVASGAALVVLKKKKF